MNKRPLAPKFLNKLDNNLLLNRPDTWSTRFHLVLYYGLIFILALTLLCLIAPTDHREKTFYGLWSGAAGVLALIGFIVWLVYLFRFNVFKSFGTVFPGDRLKTFLMYFFIISMMMIVVYIPPSVECFRADRAYSSEELGKEMNKINELVAQLEYDRIPDVWQTDTFQVVERGYEQEGINYPDRDTIYYATPPGFYYTKLDSSQVKWRLAEADSSKRLNDSVYVALNFFNLVFIQDSRVSKYSPVYVKNNLDLYYSVFRNHQPVNKAIAQNELQNLLDKYRSSSRDYYNNGYAESQDISYSIRTKYDLYATDQGFDYIADRKYRLRETDFEDFIRFTYYFALTMTLFVFIFRHSTIKTFFLSILVGVVLAILSGLFIGILGFHETGIYFLLILYYAAFCIIALLSFKSKSRSVVNGIALNILVFMTTFMPLVGTALYHRIDRDRYYANGGIDYYRYSNEALHYHIAELVGAFILLVLIETLFKRLYRAWYASPEE